MVLISCVSLSSSPDFDEYWISRIYRTFREPETSHKRADGVLTKFSVVADGVQDAGLEGRVGYGTITGHSPLGRPGFSLLFQYPGGELCNALGRRGSRASRRSRPRAALPTSHLKTFRE